MTGQELSTIARQGLNPIVFILNNKGYTTERFISDGPYNDIGNWQYHRWTEVLGAGWGCEVRTEGELEQALEKALDYTDAFVLVNMHLDPYDRSEALDRLGKSLGQQVKKRVRARK
jgi:indolepyruvate decarboxylase